MSETASKEATLLVSGVAIQRTADQREARLSNRLLKGVSDAVPRSWTLNYTWGETDGAKGALKKLDSADAVVIMGGPDISPSHYGGEAVYPNAEKHYPKSDDAQLELIAESLARGVPLFGICRGMQALNVALGGDLIQDLGVPGHVNSTFLDDLEFELHNVEMDPGSRLAATLSLKPGEVIAARSAHHQGVGRLGSNLRAVAYANDGVVEAVEHTSGKAMAVQWHPEAPGSHPHHLRLLLESLQL